MLTTRWDRELLNQSNKSKSWDEERKNIRDVIYSLTQEVFFIIKSFKEPRRWPKHILWAFVELNKIRHQHSFHSYVTFSLTHLVSSARISKKKVQKAKKCSITKVSLSTKLKCV